MATNEELPRVSEISKRGFATMDPERQREMARKGGASVPPHKRSFSTDRGLAARAGRKGGETSYANRTSAAVTTTQPSLLDGHRPQRDF